MLEIQTIIFWVGLVLVAMAFLQLTLGLLATARQHGLMGSRKKLNIEILKARLEAEKQLVVERSATATLGWNGYRKFKVTELNKEANGITSVVFTPHDERPLPPFEPGQYLTFELNVPGQDKPLTRCYSLSDGPKENTYRITVKKVPPPRDRPELPSGKSSTYFNEHVQVGYIIDLKAPSGAFHINLKENSGVVLIGGGIGVTPVYSMLKALDDLGSEREAWFFYGVRNDKEFIYAEDFKKIAVSNPNAKINICYSSAWDGPKDPNITYHNERVSVDLMKRLLPSSNYNFYICGPPPFMNAVVEGLTDWGAPKKKVHFEAFGPATVKKAKPAAKPVEGAEKIEIPVKFARAGKDLKWCGNDETLLELGEANEVGMSSGCRVGNCGVCAVALKKGEIDYAKEPSFDIEKGTCLPCIGMPSSEVEIDA
ncbi:MAG: 2Fe-2S iron-sulfur cluster binding domain-containing protein [Halobacteriovoraceae bacterium]|nr:2Fe-2S iron-sulfur cluster binding domain-containing protein [Halobacteriovoraceae bacterium]MBT5095320.1 2Fe-2S iron-sulfur cluster binding domain-containing protein [Halobacteriovoraceae bacterium]